MYLKLQEFNLENLYIQRYLNLLQLLFIFSVKEASSHRLFFFSMVCNTDESISSNKLIWEELLLFVCKSHKKFYFKWNFGDEFDKKFNKILDVSSVFSFYKFKKTITWMCIFCRFFSSVSYKLKLKFNKKTQKFENIFSLVSSVKNLQKAWYEIKSKSKNLIVKNIRIKILNSLKLEWFKKVSVKLNSGFYKYKSVRQILVNKLDKMSKRVIIVESFRDKIVQKAVLWILQQIYEGVSFCKFVDYEIFKRCPNFNYLLFGGYLKPIKIDKEKKIYKVRKWVLKPLFNHNLSGFKPNRSVHLALNIIKKFWAPVVWFWSADFIKVFNKINYNKLITEIEKKIDDFKLTNELCKMLKIKIIHFKNINVDSSAEMLQGNILSFFLFNIYLSSLDRYICVLKKNFDWESIFTQNPKVYKFIFTGKKNFKNVEFWEFIKKIKFKWNKNTKVGISPIITRDQSIQIHYVRYADNILFGFNMSKILAKKIIENICMFIKFELHLNCYYLNDKSKLVHSVSELITFLGFKVGCYSTKYNRKSKHLTWFYKLMANIWRKKMVESEKYFKMQEFILSKASWEILHSISKTGQILIKKSCVKSVYDHQIKIKVIKALKNSLTSIETEIIVTPLVSYIFKKSKKNQMTPFGLAEQKRLNLLKYMTQKWVQKAQDIANKKDFDELQNLIKNYLSFNFIQARKIYLKELNKFASKNFNEKVIEYIFKKAKVQSVSKKNSSYRSIKLLFPKKDFVKKFRALGILHKIKTRPVGVRFLVSFKDHDIVNWFSLKAYKIWNYYSCADNIWDVKNIINWILRYSMLATLAMKYKLTIKQSIQKYSLSPCLTYFCEFNGKMKKVTLAKYPTLNYFNEKKKEFNFKDNFTSINRTWKNC